MTKKACEWIEFDIENYKNTVEAAMADEKQREKIQLRDSDVRMALEDSVPITHTEADFIQAIKFKFQRDMEMIRKLASLKYTTSPQQQ
jgi:hypothetical protein